MNNDKPLASDNVDGTLLRITGDHIATPICYMLNLSLLESVCPQAWSEAKVIQKSNTFLLVTYTYLADVIAGVEKCYLRIVKPP